MKRILTIQDFSCVGKCSLTAALPVISAAGIEACGIPTALLSNHTGFNTYYSHDLTDRISPIGRQLKAENITFDAIYTGYIASVEQMALISELLDEFRRQDTIVFVDPVMGDNGKLYSALSQEHSSHMMKLCRKADILAPNITEACMLTGMEYIEQPSPALLKEMLKKLWHEDARFVVITGAHDSGRVGAVGYDGSSFCECFTPREDILCMGTGDLFASALISAVMRGAQYSRALEIAVGFTYEAVRITAAAPDRRFYGMHFEQALPMLIDQLSALDES